jgi:hypothetical protein
MAAMVREDDIIRAEAGNDADRDGLLTQRDMQRALEFSGDRSVKERGLDGTDGLHGGEKLVVAHFSIA